MTKALQARCARRVLGLFAKAPRLGQVKTRLAAAVSNQWAASVAEAFLLDTIERLTKVAAQRSLYFSPRDAGPYFEGLAAHGFTLAPQAEGDLGERMTVYFAEQFRAGATKVVLLGSDSPTLPTAYIEEGFALLDGLDVVLGPAMDGGFYLVGCTRELPAIFRNIAWGSNQVLRDTIRAIKVDGCRLALLPPWYDVDTLDDWRMLQGHVTALRQAGLDPAIPHTERLLQEPVP